MLSKKDDVRKGIRYEKIQAKKHRGKHKGGPRNPDYKRGNVKAEVKNWERPVHSGVIKEAKANGIKEFQSHFQHQV